MQLFYSPDIDQDTAQFEFTKEESKHIIKVLRHKEGDILNITNGKGWLFEAEIIVADPRSCVIKINSKVLQPQKSYSLNIAIAPTKMNDRFEWFLEKATEIGIDSITPILCANSERKIIKPERMQKIILSAMKQSLQCYLPRLNPMISFDEFVKSHKSEQKFIAHCDDGQGRKLLKSKLIANTTTTILIGPEGDFNSKEIDQALNHDYEAVSLGNNRLRTETAAIAACHTAALINQT